MNLLATIQYRRTAGCSRCKRYFELPIPVSNDSRWIAEKMSAEKSLLLFVARWFNIPIR